MEHQSRAFLSWRKSVAFTNQEQAIIGCRASKSNDRLSNDFFLESNKNLF